MILKPLIDIAISLKNPPSDSQGEILKKARTLLAILLSWVAKTALIRNSHVFTLNIVDNEFLVTIIQTFCNFEVEQYMSLFERFSRSPKALSINL